MARWGIGLLQDLLHLLAADLCRRVTVQHIATHVIRRPCWYATSIPFQATHYLDDARRQKSEDLYVQGQNVQSRTQLVSSVNVGRQRRERHDNTHALVQMIW
ncbi:hypothetical protein HBI56_138540 [Parastagonospora nodorum]|uniref:Secreted protein n=1 Tax=Phaeosphaeria nodorum (strain SN15 / ATCC MYA-4574 / FGSC 10173) TaxID=321614 RepID=A0A7U2I9A1_PHANO|nr:hypothetical protein HBH56_129270 [Parastagonospora nodorum]QRD05606.1 hypothetical protein JI435_444650 [Parastagonospora nodorum SN15]KAH3931691.1 hypothetical protein HBH54_094210 [Parastagonospora nodorum]KAH3947157.1 hypothetical protein HBH53_119550 [Parastagonospora nodorum]KAH3970673.1 hypothetical protein HBH51_115970 [Parastagonospora nodorum]